MNNLRLALSRRMKLTAMDNFFKSGVWQFPFLTLNYRPLGITCYNLISFQRNKITILTGRLGSCTSATPCFWYILDHKGPFSIRNGLFPPFSYNICYPKAPQLFLAYLSCLFLPTWLNISSQNWRSIAINYFEVDNSGLVCTQCPEKKINVIAKNVIDF